jgi:hypothetical protein
MLETGRLRVRVPMKWIFPIYVILPAALGPGVPQPLIEMFTRNRKICSWRVEHDRCVGLTIFPSSVSRLSRQCGIPNISQPCRPPRSVWGIALTLLLVINSLPICWSIVINIVWISERILMRLSMSETTSPPLRKSLPSVIGKLKPYKSCF